MPDVILFPGAGSAPAPGPTDLDAIGDRYTELLEAREAGTTTTLALLANACADDIPALVDRIGVLERELASQTGGGRRG